MNSKIRLKRNALIGIYTFILVGLVTGTIIVKNNMDKKTDSNDTEHTYVSSIILSNEIPVVKETNNTMITPFTDKTVTIGKAYYDYKAESKEQEKTITYYDNSYIQNSGVDYISENVFDVVAVLKGTVMEVKDDDILGKVVEIKHENNFVTSYQSLSEVSVAKGDVLQQGQVIGKSGINKIDESLGNHLHFELYNKGQVVNPTDYINKELTKEE